MYIDPIPAKEESDIQIETPGEEPEQPSQEISPEETIEKLKDPNFLPTREQITSTFTEWGQFLAFCSDKKNGMIYEFLNEEYLNALVGYFVNRVQEIGASLEKPLVILEICAGNGRLSHFLRKKLEERVPGLTKVIATDSGEKMIKNNFAVEKMRHDEAIEKHNPDIVICSWMPVWTDLTKEIRKCNTVQEYILIGEDDYGCCGDSWDTWGKSSDNRIPAYRKDGFRRKDLWDLCKLQICRTDIPEERREYSHSRTVSFKRQATKPGEII